MGDGVGFRAVHPLEPSARLFPRRFAENRISFETNFVPLWIYVITAAADVSERGSVEGLHRRRGGGEGRLDFRYY